MESVPSERPAPSYRQPLAEILLILLVFFVYAGWPPPSVNEPHYLAKAKHYWNPAWCQGDLFLESANVHLAFYWTIGWLTQFMSLASTAWIGRWISWLLLAVSWQRLSFTLIRLPYLSCLTAAIFLMLTHYGHMSGEWVVGGVEAKTLAYPLVLFGLTALITNRWRSACVWFGFASAFHVLVGGWSCVAAAWVWWNSRENRPTIREMLPWLLITGLLSLPGLLPPLIANWGVSPALAHEANRIYVYERLSHHLIFHRFPHSLMARHALLIALWLAMSWYGTASQPLLRLRKFVAGAILLAVAGVIVDQATLYVPQIAAGMLKYYWFRLSDAVTPLGVALGWGVWYEHWRVSNPPRAAWWLIVCLLGVTVGVVTEFWPHFRDPRPAAITMMEPGDVEDIHGGQATYRDWLLVCHWIETHTSPKDVVFTPRQQQTFKWYASRPEYFCWKDVPQDAESLSQWWKRREWAAVARYALAMPDDVGVRFPWEELDREGVRYWIAQAPETIDHAALIRVYPTHFEPNASFTVYILRSPTEGLRDTRSHGD